MQNYKEIDRGWRLGDIRKKLVVEILNAFPKLVVETDTITAFVKYLDEHFNYQGREGHRSETWDWNR